MLMGGESEPIPARPDALAGRLARAVEPRYRLGPRLGRGGMAIVYGAVDTTLGREVAIKVIDPERTYEDGAEARFRAEAIAAAGLRHPHIVSIHEWGEQDDLLWFVMDKLSGGSLRDLLRRESRLPVARAARLLGQIAAALHHAHRQGVLHRDINPANILLDALGNAFVADFGIAKTLGASTLTETGASVGTAQYMSPEQLLQGGEVTPASDQFALGVTAFEMVSGIRPFTGDTPAQLAVALDRGRHRSLLELVPDCPRDYAALVERMIARQPGDRWSDLGLIQRLAEELAVTGSAPSLRSSRPPASKRRTRRVIWTVVTVGAAAGAGWGLGAPLFAPPAPLPTALGQAPEQVEEEPGDTATRDSLLLSVDTGPGLDQVVDPAPSPPPAPAPVTRRAGVSPPPVPAAGGGQLLETEAVQDSAVVPARDASPPIQRTGPSRLYVGSRDSNVYMYVNGENRFLLKDTLLWLPVNEVGMVRLSFVKQGCRNKDTTLTLPPKVGDTLSLGYRYAQCP